MNGRSPTSPRTIRFAVQGALPLLGTLLVASCSGNSGSGFGTGNRSGSPASTSSSGGSGGASGDLVGDAAVDECSGSEPEQGCVCPQAGQTVACWTGPANMRNVGVCHDGTRHCINYGETAAWGPCGGQQLNCGTTATPDAGKVTAPDAGPPTPTPDAGVCSMPQYPTCIPGSARYCDDGSCYWGTQTCASDGTWGECDDTPGNQGPSGCQGISYDANCCVLSGSCCAYAEGGENGGSVGTCGNVAPCDSCAQLCVAGAVRWCSVPTGGDYDIPDMGPWGQQTCGSNGTWGACGQVSTAPTGCTAGSYDSACCDKSGECCEIFDDEDADPVSVNCPQPSCTPRAPTGDGSQDSDSQDSEDSQDGQGLVRSHAQVRRVVRHLVGWLSR